MLKLFGRGDGAEAAAPAPASADDSSSLLASMKRTIGNLSGGASQPEPEQGLLSEFKEALSTDWGLTWSQRLTGFGACFSLGLLCSFLSTLFMLHPTKFGITYSLGNLLSLGSTGFLVGPGRQMQNMFKAHRALATLIFVAMLGCTLYAAIHLRNTPLTLVFIVLQMSAFSWYCLSYIPYARALVKRCLGNCCPDEDF